MRPGYPTLAHPWKRKRGTNKWYVYTFIADRPFRAVKAKIPRVDAPGLHRADGTVITRIQPDPARLDQLLPARRLQTHPQPPGGEFFVNWRLDQVANRKRHRWGRWGGASSAARFTTPSGRWLPFTADGVELFNRAW